LAVDGKIRKNGKSIRNQLDLVARGYLLGTRSIFLKNNDTDTYV
jgi:hypothetical protein